MTGPARIPYYELPDERRAAIRAWMELHGVDPRRVPIDGCLEFDSATREWVIEAYHLRAGSKYYVGDGIGHAARCVLRRVELAPLPWPTHPAPVDADQPTTATSDLNAP